MGLPRDSSRQQLSSATNKSLSLDANYLTLEVDHDVRPKVHGTTSLKTASRDIQAFPVSKDLAIYSMSGTVQIDLISRDSGHNILLLLVKNYRATTVLRVTELTL